ncbi:MAG TPA: UDP-N-acetylglucosamine 2-epimerase (non-hydrolyzing) [Candidatus Omnitrophota bacterium]|nr:UDP-N-acetylglucosamine 2-epimerase (non-hydrolyzing) [Candidatus Omnitrophota bacterium]HPT07756.1 UDP-N-acetylglucosamine 2-epimerase (non-hydrolyzing) [Candidatus Omnitrophota bacterium]
MNTPRFHRRKKKLKVIVVAGARPNFMKVAPLIRQIRLMKARIELKFVHTGQHYDRNMSGIFFEELGMPRPDMHLGVGSGTHGEQTAGVLLAFEKILFSFRPDVVVVVGDVNSTLACALAASKLGIKIAHIEAGLRSFDRSMPEEINRIMTDKISDFLFTPSRDADRNLIKEGVARSKIFFVGNIMADSLLAHRAQAQSLHAEKTFGLTKNNYILVTAHRPATVDTKETLHKLLQGLSQLSRNQPVVFPMHPRTKSTLASFGLTGLVTLASSGNTPYVRGKVLALEPLGYLPFLSLMASASFVITDSGGIQEETTILKVPCLTFRETTERPITVTQGTNTVLGLNQNRLLKESKKILNGTYKKTGRIPELWDGRTAQRILRILLKQNYSYKS